MASRSEFFGQLPDDLRQFGWRLHRSVDMPYAEEIPPDVTVKVWYRNSQTGTEVRDDSRGQTWEQLRATLIDEMRRQSAWFQTS